MERSRDHDEIAFALAEMRPAPREEFARELDEWAAAGFPPPKRAGRWPLSGLAARFHGLAPRQLAFATGGAALAAIAIATVVVASNSEPDPGPVALDQSRIDRPERRLESSTSKGSGGIQFSETVPRAASAPENGAAHAESSANVPSESLAGGEVTAGLGQPMHRDIERSAEVGLLADPADVADDSAAVFAAVHDARGIVLHSTSRSGHNAGARFELLIPSARLGDALAAFSAIDEVHTRHEATTDITKPSVSAAEALSDSRAKIDGLLAQLAGAETEAERDAIETELREERQHAAALRARLSRLRDRANFSRVLVRIEAGHSETGSGGAWGIGDAFHDAGRILGIAAGVILIGLAALAPVALLALLVWLARRAWLQRARNRALT